MTKKKKKISEEVLAAWECSARLYTGFTNVCTCAQVFSIGWERAQVKTHRIRKSLITDSHTFTETQRTETHMEECA